MNDAYSVVQLFIGLIFLVVGTILLLMVVGGTLLICRLIIIEWLTKVGWK